MYSLILSLVNAGEVNFTAIPIQLKEKLMLSTLYEAKLLASIIVMACILIPVLIFSRNFILSLIFLFMILFFETAIGWLDGWIMIVLTMLVSGLFTWNLFGRFISGK